MPPSCRRRTQLVFFSTEILSTYKTQRSMRSLCHIINEVLRIAVMSVDCGCVRIYKESPSKSTVIQHIDSCLCQRHTGLILIITLMICLQIKYTFIQYTIYKLTFVFSPICLICFQRPPITELLHNFHNFHNLFRFFLLHIPITATDTIALPNAVIEWRTPRHRSEQYYVEYT